MSDERAQLSVIIPTLHEERALPLLLSDLRAQRGVAQQLIIADGGSTDRTPQLALEAGALLVQSAPGRARQLNAALPKAQAPWVAILHADSRLHDRDALRAALDALERAQARWPKTPVAGHGMLRFDGELPKRHPLACRALELKTSLNRPGTTRGDQGFFAPRGLFESLGGFDERADFLEDHRMAERVRERARWITLPITLTTSSRRFDVEGFRARYVWTIAIMGAEAAGFEGLLRAARYAPQHQTGALDLDVFLALVRAEHARLTRAQQRALWRDVGRYTRQNLWQAALWLDALEQAQPHPHEEPPWLARFARRLEARLDRPWIERLCGLAACLYFIGQPWPAASLEQV